MNTSPLFDALYVKLRAFLLDLVPSGTQVVKGLGNRVPQPAAPVVYVTGLFERRLRTNVATYEDDESTGGTKSLEQGTEIHVQFDYYGPTAADLAAKISTVFRDEYAVNALAPEVSPLYIDDARQMPFETGESQYELRYTSTAVLQYNPTVTLPQEFADEATVGLVEVETLAQS